MGRLIVQVSAEPLGVMTDKQKEQHYTQLELQLSKEINQRVQAWFEGTTPTEYLDAIVENFWKDFEVRLSGEGIVRYTYWTEVYSRRGERDWTHAKVRAGLALVPDDYSSPFMYMTTDDEMDPPEAVILHSTLGICNPELDALTEAPDYTTIMHIHLMAFLQDRARAEWIEATPSVSAPDPTIRGEGIWAR